MFESECCSEEKRDFSVRLMDIIFNFTFKEFFLNMEEIGLKVILFVTLLVLIR